MKILKEDFGRKVFSIVYGWGEIIKVNSKPYDEKIAVWVTFKHTCNNVPFVASYSVDGRNGFEKYPSLRWDEVDIKKSDERPEKYITISEKEFRECLTYSNNSSKCPININDYWSDIFSRFK